MGFMKGKMAKKSIRLGLIVKMVMAMCSITSIYLVCLTSEPSFWKPQTRCPAWKLVLSEITSHAHIDCGAVEEAISKQHIISNYALGVDLSKAPEHLVLKVMRPLVQTTAFPVMVDVGANLGQLSVAALKEFRGLRSFLFEPTPSTCIELLERLVDSGVVDRGILACTAATSSYATVLLGMTNVNTSNHIGLISEEDAEGTMGVPVDRTIPMDLDIVLFKTDTQGFEWDVLEGSKVLLMDGKRVQAVMVEVSYSLLELNKRGRVADLLQKIMRMGYTCTTMGWHGVVRLDGNKAHYGLVASPLLSERSFSPEELQNSLQRMGPTGQPGWTDVLCVPV